MSLLIAIDGPAGSGKSTIAAAVALRLGLERLDTGAMYRAVTLLVLRGGADPSDASTAGRMARDMSLSVGAHVILDGEDVTDAIRSEAVDAAVSAVSAHPGVRAELVRRQRQWRDEHGGGVVEGRDIGSVVFPEAHLKVYLTADPLERARRRSVQRSAAGATGAAAGAASPRGPDHAVADLVRRDSSDSTRAASPLQVADGAIVVDSTGRSVDEVVEEVLGHL